MTQEEIEIRNWLSKMLNEDLKEESLFNLLRDGVILKRLVNVLNGVKTTSTIGALSKAPFIQMENICYFIEQAKAMGVPDSEIFTTVDLFEGKNMRQVIICLYSLSRNLVKNGRKDVPLIGARLVDSSKKGSYNDDNIKISTSHGFEYAKTKENESNSC